MRAVVEADPRRDAGRTRTCTTRWPSCRCGSGEEPQPDRVQVASPLDVRARRFEAVFVCGLQESEFPAGRLARRRSCPTPTGASWPAPAACCCRCARTSLERERYLFYVCASRAERRLVLSSRYCDEEGNPQAPSFFVDDARAVFAATSTSARRSLADVTWPLDEAPTEAEWERAVAARRAAPPGPGGRAAGPARRRSEPLAARDAVSAGALERFAGCPVSWLVDDVLEPEKLEPDPEPMVRGSYAHRVLEVTFRRAARARRASAGSRPPTCRRAERILLEALEAERGEFRLSPNQTRVRAAVRRLEFDLLRYLRHEAGRDGSFEPEYLELRFGFEDSDHPAVELADGTRVRGRDRPRRHLGRLGPGARLQERQGRLSTRSPTGSKENRFQAALYMLVAERALGLEPAGGVYVPLAGTERRAARDGGRGAGRAAGHRTSYDNDRGARGRVRRAHRLGARASIARDGRAHARRATWSSCPDSCAWRGGCSHPSICRVET